MHLSGTRYPFVFSFLILAVTTGKLLAIGPTSPAEPKKGYPSPDFGRSAPASVQLLLTAPSRMVDSKTFTLKGEILTADGSINWQDCNQLGTVSATRVSDNSSVPISITVFETFNAGAGAGTPPADSIRFYNGVGSVSFTLDEGAAAAPGDIRVTVTVGGLSASKIVTVLDGDQPGLFRNLSGTLSGADLTWGPSDGVIHLTSDVTVATGNVLTILPGTLVMVDSGSPNDGVAVLAVGGGVVNAAGTPNDPIFFFATAGPAAMALPQDRQNNDSSWRGFYHFDTGTSHYSYVFVTGAGNAIVTSHPRPPIFRFENAHGMVMENCVVADCPGMVNRSVTGANGTYTIRQSLYSRCGIGGEWLGSGYNLTVEDCWFTRIGRAPEPLTLDGDMLHIDQPGNSAHVRRCLLTDCGDDMIDTSDGAQPVAEDCILYDCRDKTVSLDGAPGSSVTMTNCLIFDNPNGIVCRGLPAFLTSCTIGQNAKLVTPNCTSSVINKCIVWPSTQSSCCGTVSYSDLGAGSDLSCGAGNFSSDPQFVQPDPLGCDYDLDSGSPASIAGPVGDRIGWLGFTSPRRGALLSGTISATAAIPNGTVNYTLFAQDARNLGSYQTFLSITRTSGGGSLTIDCPGGVVIDQQRGDYVFFGMAGASVNNDCSGGSASSSLSSGFVNIGDTPGYLSTFTLRVSSDATQNATFEIRVLGFGGSSLADANSQPIAFAVGPVSTLTIGLCPTVVAGNDLAVCAGGTASLSGSQSHASGTNWSTAGDGNFGDSSQLNTTYSPGANDIAAGSVILTLSGGPTAPCQVASSDTLVLTIQRQPTAAAGSDQALCNGSSADLFGGTQFSSGCTWTTAGDGMFNDASSLTPTYTPGATDISEGHTTLTLSCSAISPCATPATSAVTVSWTPGSSDGDMNGDGQTNGADISQFIGAVISQSRAAADVCPGDFTLDGVVLDDDVPGMVNRLLGI